SIRRILTSDLGVTRKKKLKTHTLTPKQCQQRLDRGPGFLEYLTPRKLRYIFTFDETWVDTNDLDGQTNFYYEPENMVVPESWKQMPKSSWPKKPWLLWESAGKGDRRSISSMGKLKLMP